MPTFECTGSELLDARARRLGSNQKLKPRRRAEVKAVREKKGVSAAIKKAKKLAAG